MTWQQLPSCRTGQCNRLSTNRPSKYTCFASSAASLAAEHFEAVLRIANAIQMVIPAAKYQVVAKADRRTKGLSWHSRCRH
jgi:hypothetical protein